MKKKSKVKEAEPAGIAKVSTAEGEGGEVFEAEDAASTPAGIFPIVGIGASAGGLAAFEAFFLGMPAITEPGMSFVLVQHLAPDHKSILTDLIRRYTRMQVFEVKDGIRVRPNCTYIIPPGRDMVLLNGTLAGTGIATVFVDHELHILRFTPLTTRG